MTLTLISCNIRFDNPADGPNAWKPRRTFLARVLLQHQPDIIATQEGRIHQLKDLEGLLPGYVLLDTHRSWIKERMYPSLFIRRDKFEVLKSDDQWLSETPEIAGSLSFGSSFPRLMTMSRLQIKNSEQTLTVANTHLDHMKAETREEQVKVLSAAIKRFRDQESPLVIMGDFNDSPESQVRLNLLSEFPDLQDAWKLFNHKEETSHHAFKGFMPEGARIDWIMVDEKLKVESCKMEKISDRGLYPTDHFPIVCKISL